MTATATGSLDDATLAELLAPLAQGNDAWNGAHPGEPEVRQPVHTVYGGAQLFRADTGIRMGELALRAVEAFAPTPDDLAEALGWDDPSAVEGAATLAPGLVEQVHARMVAKLEREAVEDFRIDFEDGYGNRPDDVEDAEAVRCAEAVADGAAAGTLPPFIGIRIKTLSNELAPRALRTLDLFLTTLAGRVVGRPTSIADEPGDEAGTTTHVEPHLHHTASPLPANFVVTVPKVVHAGQVAAVDAALGRIERATGLPIGSTRLELMVETPQSIIGDDGACPLPAFVDAGNGRVRGAHFGTYDYTALVGVTAAQQHMNHPATGFARHVMQVSLAQRGVLLSDGATNVMPVGPHRAAPGTVLTGEQVLENRDVVRRAWRLYQKHVRTSLERGLYQGWDLHPAQLPVRYAVTYAFFLEGLEAATERLRTFVEKAGQATLLGDVFDDAATGQGLLNVFLRGIACGAVTEDEATATGLTVEELRTRSFKRILELRTARS